MDFIIESANNNANNFADLSNTAVGHANIKVIGSGGAGCNVVTWLYKKGIQGADIVACNTDYQHLKISEADKKILLGRDTSRGLGAGGFPKVGRESASESMNELKEVLKGSDMVFVCAGMGGGTGTGSAPVIAEVAKSTGAIVIGAVTMPFKIERARIDKAEYGLQELRKACDTVIVIDNNVLVQIAGGLPIQQAFAVANELISTMIKGIVEIIAVPSLVNLDFADVKAIMTNGDVAIVGVGTSDTNARVEEAVQGALKNPLLDISYEGATGALIHVTGGPDMTLDDVNNVGELVTESLDSEATVIWGARIDDNLKGKLMVMTIITGVKSPWILGRINNQNKAKQPAARAMTNELGIQVVR